jgi:hypothetical protein
VDFASSDGTDFGIDTFTAWVREKPGQPKKGVRQ